MMHNTRLAATLLACLTIFPNFINAFWRLPCRGRLGVARLDPLIDPGKVASHAHSIHGAGSFSMNSNQQTLQKSSCTSCAVMQDKSAYWTPTLYFMHPNGSAELVEQVGGMLAYYLLYGENVTAFPQGFRMIAGDPFQRNFTWPVPDPPKSLWKGAQESQRALRQKALGFNCLNYAEAAEPSLYRHFLPNKTFLDEHCTDGIRLELMFPSCWNGKDVDSPDHKSHVAYPSLVMDGTCPEGYETRLVSLFYETIWNTYAFKDKEGFFTLANGDPTGFGYHGDYLQAWDDGVLQKAVNTCTNETGLITDCDIFDLQNETDQNQCQLDLPPQLQHENVHMHADGLPGNMPIEWGPGYAMRADKLPGHPTTTTEPVPSIPTIPSLSIPDLSIPTLDLDPTPLFDKLHVMNTAEAAADPTTTDPAPASTDSVEIDPVTREIIYMEQDIIVMVNGKGEPYTTSTGRIYTKSTTTTTISKATTVVFQAEKNDTPEKPVKHDHARRHAHNYNYGHLRHKRDLF
ncbi:hypothetical protein N7510_004968 [Penicillium lagena]|uniref:uncharacterized protein n=1 Tax=Penicillium lagena TaxID=94218 RepID=UPI0025411026|nr:uncharacterized protein N7510_004968 [Penicillium lagena]KAJ5620984.1 hypothetical protein N7510_004968 [Penicillium lagena]